MARGKKRQKNRYRSAKNTKPERKPVEEEEPVETEKKRISTGFPTLDGYTSDGETEAAVHVKKKKSGGFQSMGLSRNVFLGILRKGYKVPTPIQRKCIPVILEGKDVVGMARTGSGKTAAFLVPMLEHLTTKMSHAPGCRALILSPTRELAIQTLKFTKELGKLCSLKAELILGGDSLEEQFAALHTFPDILIATPGRLLHVMVEMNMKLSNVEYLVFDEADRLFEMGFAEQLQEILRRVPEHRQTLLFSATLPKSLVEFAQAGLHDPTLIRLDVDNKISQDLKMAYFFARSGEKNAVLLHLLRNVVKPDELTVIFVATKHHIEYLREILDSFDISCTHIFSALDPSARKINIAKFASKKTHILLVTDVAARGIDIPMLDNVINYNFPGKPKLFVHRVGRVARAGRSGTAYSIIGPDEVPYLLDLHLFLGRPLKMAKSHYKKGEDSVLGRVPQEVLDEEEEELRYKHEHSCDLVSLRKVVTNAMKLYLKSRPLPSTASIKRSKEINMDLLLHHPLFEAGSTDRQISLADEIKKYKPHSTIFEINATKTKTSNTVMRKKREKHNRFIQKSRKAAEERDHEVNKLPAIPVDKTLTQEVFFDVTDKKVSNLVFEYDRRGKQLPASSYKDDEFYIPHVPSGDKTEKGLGINSFEQQASQDVLNLTHDEREAMHRDQHQMKWDRKRKRFVGSGGKEHVKKLKTESGNYIPASYSKQLYEKWLKKSKEEGVNFRQLAEEFDAKEEEEDGAEGEVKEKGIRSSGFQSQFRHRKGVSKKVEQVEAPANEVLSNEAILKNRKQKAIRTAKHKMKHGKKMRKRTKDKYGAKKPLIYSGMNSYWRNQKGRQSLAGGKRGRGKGRD